MTVFPHGTGDGNKPTRYLVRLDYPDRKNSPPEVLRGDVAMTCALIDSIDRKWKYTAGALSWNPDDTLSPEKEEKMMDAFEQVAFAGLDPDQRYILWVRHLHAGHHELHFVIPRLELSSGKDVNACPPGWQKDFDVFRDLHNHKEQWARPEDPDTDNPDVYKAHNTLELPNLFCLMNSLDDADGWADLLDTMQDYPEMPFGTRAELQRWRSRCAEMLAIVMGETS